MPLLVKGALNLVEFLTDYYEYLLHLLQIIARIWPALKSNEICQLAE